MFKNKKVLITGGSGMIGRQLVKLLQEKSADIYIADLSEPLNMDNITFNEVDTRYDKFSIEMIGGMPGEDNLILHSTSPDDVVQIFDSHIDTNLSTSSKIVFDFSYSLIDFIFGY